MVMLKFSRTFIIDSFSNKARAMLTTIEGIYENGTITLSEALPIAGKAKVIVIFLEEKKGVRLGSLEGKASIPDDFNEPLEDFEN